MARCSPGDRVVCHLKDSKIVSVYEEKFDNYHVFEIIALYGEGYLIYIPMDLYLLEYISIDTGNIKKYGLDQKFVGSYVCHISEYKVAGIYSKVDGMCCKRCKYFYPMATPNQPDQTLLCWACRTYRFR